MVDIKRCFEHNVCHTLKWFLKSPNWEWGFVQADDWNTSEAKRTAVVATETKTNASLCLDNFDSPVK